MARHHPGAGKQAGKRPHDVVDLTEDDNAYLPQRKQPRVMVPSSPPPLVVDDDAEVLDLTQVEDGPPRELYGNMDIKIVGVRYYDGYATPGETVICLREPGNQYDANAIRVDNVAGRQIGHIPRREAAKLAPYMDSGDVSVESQLTGEKGAFDCPIRLSLYGACGPIERERLEQRMKADKLLKVAELKQTKKTNSLQRDLQRDLQRAAMGLGLNGDVPMAGRAESSKPARQPERTMADLVQISQAVNLRSSEDLVKTLAMDEEQLSKMPEADQPSQIKTRLHAYQLQGLAWLKAKESPTFPPRGAENAVQLWKREQNGRYLNAATKFAVKEAPKLLSGGILADDMGLGKTVQILSLILTAGPGPTLIVAPLTVMSNWEQQAQRHVEDGHTPRVLIYHGNQKTANQAEMRAYDIVITSYGTLTSAHGYREGANSPLFTVNWRRVVLDEGHIIRNVRTKTAEAACGLKAQSRWVLTGTPIVNNVKDLHSLLKFLRITGGIEQPEIFNAVIARGLAFGDQRADSLLQSLMVDLCLRRNKDMKFVDLNLPPKTEYVHRIKFLPEEQNKYKTLLAEAQGALKKFQERSKGQRDGGFQSVLERLLRLRQVCCHWTLCRQRMNELFKLLGDDGVVELTDKNRAILQEALRLYVESQEDCCVCLDNLTAPVITHCKHVFCRGCITKVVTTQAKCPMCRADLTEDKLVEPAAETSGEADLVGGDFDAETQSSKTLALLNILQATLKKRGSKVIIFSQWTSFLTIIQHQLDEAGYKYTRIDGSMTTAARDASMRALENDDNTRILLASLQVCSVGLNLLAADTVVLADSWWAPAIEDQAVDRVHRLGQTRPTTVWRLVMEESVEEHVLDIQAEKRKLVSKAFQDKGKKQAKETRMGDIVKLLG